MKFAAAAVLLLALASVATARPVGLRSLLSDEKKAPVYCEGPDHGSDYKDECPEHYECAKLDKPVCKPKVCTKDKYGKEECDQECHKYVCKELPKYCEVVYGKEDQCATKYGKDHECKELVKPECVYDKECEYKDTKVCKEYEYENKCVYVDTDICKEYKQVQKCEKDRQVCKAYKQLRKCTQGKCTAYDKYGKCTKYDQDCDYVDTDKCKVYETVKGKCTYVNTTCKEYEQKEECEKVKKGCKVYEQEEVCEDVKVCWTGKCVIKKATGYSAGK